MTCQHFGRAAAVAILLAVGNSVSASEPAPGPVAAGPVVVQGAAPCPTCNGTAAGTCQTCKGRIFGIGVKGKPYQTHLCPGACFGYFPTQWHRWEDVCPIPYPGAGLSDAPRIPTPPLTGTTPITQPPRGPVDPRTLPDPKTLPEPKPMIDPKTLPEPKPMPDPKNPKGDLPKIPLPPGN